MAKAQPSQSPRPDSIAAAIRASQPRNRPGTPPWWETVDQDVLAELAEIHDDQLEGRMVCSMTWLARKMASEMRERGIANVGYQGVIAWLKHRIQVKGLGRP